jgi:pectate lyase
MMFVRLATVPWALGKMAIFPFKLNQSRNTLLTMRSTSGGKGGETVIVSTLAALESAVAGNDPRIVVVSGTISGAKKVLVGSNKSIIGRGGGSENHPIVPLPYYC